MHFPYFLENDKHDKLKNMLVFSGYLDSKRINILVDRSSFANITNECKSSSYSTEITLHVGPVTEPTMVPISKILTFGILLTWFLRSELVPSSFQIFLLC